MNRQQRRAAKKSGKVAESQTSNLSESERIVSQSIAALTEKRLEDAEKLLRHGAELYPEHAQIVHLFGMCLYYRGDAKAGLPIVAHSLELDKDNPSYLSNYGVVAYALGDLDLAIRCYALSLKLQPVNADALTNLSAALNDKDRFAEGLVAADEAISLNPAGRGGYLNRGNALKSMDKHEDAIEAYKKSVECDPDYAEAQTMLGHAHDLLGNLALAEKHGRLAVNLSPNMYEGHNNLATILMRQGRKAEANIHLVRSQKLNPNPKTLWNMALNLLDMGDFQQGISLYEFGFEAETRQPNRKPPMPRWKGEDLTGKSILIWREQGVGDELRFAEWYHHVIAQGGRCIIEAKSKLVPLFERSFPDATILPEDFSRDIGRADADYQIPSGALPILFGLNQNTAENYSYLRADPFRAKNWRDRIADLGSGAKIGICWRSGLRSARRDFAYAELDDLIPVFELPNTQFISLNYIDCTEEMAEFERRTGHHIHSFPDLDQFDDLDETAAMTAGLDLVVTAGTAVAQMSGGLGIETWRFDARGSRPDQPPVTHPWYQPNGVLWFGHWQEPWRNVMERMAVGLGERLQNTAQSVAQNTADEQPQEAAHAS